ncbi:hypothetical protein [Nonomuraea sp. NPDC003804]|uniref:hypothetical protein n=1 Tax=Nonomuraea sp. NPDC003804 TaxID=3154547 RepID=UPI0033A2A0A5
MDAHHNPHSLTPEERADLTAEDRPAMPLVDEPQADAVHRRALAVFEERRRRGPA